MPKVLLERKDVNENLTWDLSTMFKTEKELEQAIEKAKSLQKK